MSKGFSPLVQPPLSPTLKKLKWSVIEEFEALEDPRVKREPQHKLIDIVTIAVLGILCGANSIVAKKLMGKVNEHG